MKKTLLCASVFTISEVQWEDYYRGASNMIKVARFRSFSKHFEVPCEKKYPYTSMVCTLQLLD